MELVRIAMFNITICKSLFVSGLKDICGHLNMSSFLFFFLFSVTASRHLNLQKI